MNRIRRIENLMLYREAGWWEALCEMIPELAALTETVQPPEYHAEGNVAVHTQLAVAACPKDCDQDLPWVALLHDIGKPGTTRQDESGRITAYGHAHLGAEMAEAVLIRINVPEARRDRIVWSIRYHTFHHSWQLQRAEDISKRQKTYLENPDFPLLLEFLRVDSMASQGNKQALKAYQFYLELWENLNQP